MDKFLPTHAYVDPDAKNFSVITYNNTVIFTTPIPDETVAASRYTQEQWAKHLIQKLGYKVKSRARWYPYGFYFVV